MVDGSLMEFWVIL